MGSKIPVDIDAKNKDFERTPLHEAARKGNDEVVEVLLQNGASIYEKTKHGRIPEELSNNKTRNIIKNFGLTNLSKVDENKKNQINFDGKSQAELIGSHGIYSEESKKSNPANDIEKNKQDNVMRNKKTW